MFSNKLLPITRSLVKTSAVRDYHVASTPPRVVYSSGEKVFHFVFLATAMWGYPFWVLYHIPDYQKEDRNSYTGK